VSFNDELNTRRDNLLASRGRGLVLINVNQENFPGRGRRNVRRTFSDNMVACNYTEVSWTNPTLRKL
jgi:hypothetical protein